AAQRAEPAIMPHQLAAAYVQLRESLDKAIVNFEQRRQFENTAGVFEAAGRFVAQLVGIPGGKAELRRRADFIKKATKPGNDVATSLDDARRVYGTDPPEQ